MSKISLTQKYGFWLSAGMLLVSLNGCVQKSDSANSNSRNSDRLAQIQERGTLICGVNGELPGFSFVNIKGEYVGLDVDFCRAIAAAIFDDPDRVEFRDLSLSDRFSAVKSGEIDLLSRNTTKTLSRSVSENLKFSPTIFYDGQGLMVNQTSCIKNLSDLAGKSICVQSDTTSEKNLADYMRKLEIEYTAVLVNNGEDLFDAYERQNCQAVTGDISQLIVRRPILANPQNHTILPEVISKEPLSPVISADDPEWFDVVKWITFALIEAEELGINSQNVNDVAQTKDPTIRKFLGQEGTLGEDMGLPNDFAHRIIEYVGNYGEIYERNIGQPFGLDRGQNALWKDGGLMYSPPFR